MLEADGARRLGRIAFVNVLLRRRSKAETAFADERAILIDDPDHSADEDRYLLFGLSAVLHLLVLAHSYRHGTSVVRIISARKATRSERLHYTKR